MHEIAIGPSPAFSFTFDLDKSSSRVEVLWVQEIVNGAWIVGQRKIKILTLFIHLLEVSEQRGQLLTKS